MQLLNDEIIRCSDCSHFDKDNKFCNKWFGDSEPQDFCMKGAIEEIESDNDNRGHEESSKQTFTKEPPF